MRRVLWVCAVVVLVAVAVSAWPVPRTRSEPPPAAVHFSDLPKLVYHRRLYRGEVVRVAYPLRLSPTPDPLVYEFRPGSDQLPPTHRVHFADPPALPARLPVVVVGTVEGIAPDLVMRTNNVPGAVVIRGAVVAPATVP